MNEDYEQKEYFAIVETVASFDQRLLTIKGWGVTLSLVALGLGFQYRAYGFFLVAAASSLAFWAIEAIVKRHQMRYYLRMNEIEASRYERAKDDEKAYSAPRIGWSWNRADELYRGKTDQYGDVPKVTIPWSYQFSFLLPHVFLPHLITLLISLVLFLRGVFCHLSGFSLGATGKS
jgi:hypothetical protein